MLRQPLVCVRRGASRDSQRRLAVGTHDQGRAIEFLVDRRVERGVEDVCGEEVDAGLMPQVPDVFRANVARAGEDERADRRVAAEASAADEIGTEYRHGFGADRGALERGCGNRLGIRLRG